MSVITLLNIINLLSELPVLQEKKTNSQAFLSAFNATSLLCIQISIRLKSLKYRHLCARYTRGDFYWGGMEI